MFSKSKLLSTRIIITENYFQVSPTSVHREKQTNATEQTYLWVGIGFFCYYLEWLLTVRRPGDYRKNMIDNIRSAQGKMSETDIKVVRFVLIYEWTM